VRQSFARTKSGTIREYEGSRHTICIVKAFNQSQRANMAIAVVTGTSTGIGLATAQHWPEAGHTVYATMRNPQTGGEELRAIAEREHHRRRKHVGTELGMILCEIANERQETA
jgi:hypothetical protein